MTVDTIRLLRCPTCEAVNIDKGKYNHCRRCGSKIYSHRKFRTERSWAFLITAIIFYIPANLYPMLIVSRFGAKEESTILGGVVMLWEHGSYPIALIILIASVFVPIFKFLMLIYLLIEVEYYGFKKDKKIDKLQVYYLAEIIGPWSMIDVFVVAILVGLIHLGSVAMVTGLASASFAISVFFTILAAKTFDIRVIKKDE